VHRIIILDELVVEKKLIWVVLMLLFVVPMLFKVFLLLYVMYMPVLPALFQFQHLFTISFVEFVTNPFLITLTIDVDIVCTHERYHFTSDFKLRKSLSQVQSVNVYKKKYQEIYLCQKKMMFFSVHDLLINEGYSLI